MFSKLKCTIAFYTLIVCVCPINAMDSNALKHILSDPASNSALVTEAIDQMVVTKDIDAIRVAAHSNNLDTRVMALGRLAKVEPALMADFLVELLGERDNWHKLKFSRGESFAVEAVETSEVKSYLRRLGITEAGDLFQESDRQRLVAALQSKIKSGTFESKAASGSAATPSPSLSRTSEAPLPTNGLAPSPGDNTATPAPEEMKRGSVTEKISKSSRYLWVGFAVLILAAGVYFSRRTRP